MELGVLLCEHTFFLCLVIDDKPVVNALKLNQVVIFIFG